MDFAAGMAVGGGLGFFLFFNMDVVIGLLVFTSSLWIPIAMKDWGGPWSEAPMLWRVEENN